MSRRSPPALPSQPEDPVPMEHDSDDGDGGAPMVGALTASLHFLSMSPEPLLPPPSAWETMMMSVGHQIPSPQRSPSPPWNFDDEQPLPPCSAWETMAVVGHLPPIPPRSPMSQFDDEQRLPLQMGPTANCSAAVLEAARQDTSYGITKLEANLSRCILNMVVTFFTKATVELAAAMIGRTKTFPSHGLEIHMSAETGGEILRKRPRNSLLFGLPLTELTEKLAAGVRVLEKTFELYGLEILMNTETGGSSLPMIESYDDDSDRINRARAWRRGPDLFLLMEQLAALKCDVAKTFKSYGFKIGMNSTGGSSLVMIESYDDDNELGDNDAEQIETSRKRPKNSSPVWLHFTRVLSKDSGMVTAMCKHCNNALKGASTSGTSHLLRHIKNVHQIDLPSSSEACKEPKWPSCFQKLQITGSAACEGSPTPTENNGNEIELQEKDFELGDTSKKRKGTSRTKSIVWHHFTKLPSADPGGVRAECNYCKTILKAGSQNGTSTLWRHVKKVHEEKACQEGS